MTLAVLDATDTDTHLDLVVEGWVRCGLIEPVAWCSLHPGADTAEWRLMHIDEVNAVEPNEIINALGRRSDLHVVVVAPSTSDDGSIDAILNELRRIQSDFAPTSDRAPDPVTCTLLFLPERSDRVWTLEADPRLLQSWAWSQCLVVSPEDGPTPDQGDELAERPITAIAAHCLVGVVQHWSFVPHRPNHRGISRQGDALQVRLVRCWTRVIDAGYVLDHVGAALPTVTDSSEPATAQQIELEYLDLLALPDIRDDLASGEPPASVSSAPQGLSYVIAWFKFALLKFVPELLQVLYERLLRPIVRTIDRWVRWLTARIGRPHGDDPGLDPLPPVSGPTALDKALERARSSLDLLDGSGELATPPPPNPNLWRTVVTASIELVDSGQFTVDDVTRTGHPENRSVLAMLGDEYRTQRDEARRQLEHLLTVDSNRSRAKRDDPEVGAPRGRFRSWITKLRKRSIKILVGGIIVAVGVVLIVAVPGIGAVVVGAGLLILFATKILLSACSEALKAVSEKFASQFRGDSEDLRVRRISYWAGEYEKHAYRCDQVRNWARALGAVMDRAGQGVPLSERAQGDFEPGSAPRSMHFASGAAGNDVVEEMARRIRGSETSPFFATIWQELQTGFPDLYDDASRLARHGPLSRLLEIEYQGLPDHIRDVSRDLIWGAVEAHPTACIDGAAPWHRLRDRNGLERLVPPPGATPRGPTGRGFDTHESRFEDAVTKFDACCVPVTDHADGVVGAATRVAEGTTFITALQLTAAATMELGDLGFSGWSEHPGELAVARSQAHRPARDDADVKLGGLGLVRVGRGVVTGFLDHGGIAARQATIEAVHDDGCFRLDMEAALGTPVIDGSHHVLLGVVVAASPCLVAGPLLLHSALTNGSFEANQPGELDPGLIIPIDVLMGTGVGPVPERPDDDDAIDQVPAGDWLGEITRNLLEAFPSRLFADGRYDDVDDQSLIHLAASKHPAGRLLLAAHVVQRSVPVPIEIFRTKHVAEPNPEPSGTTPGVKLDG